jgi:hypothetical protein
MDVTTGTLIIAVAVMLALLGALAWLGRRR